MRYFLFVSLFSLVISCAPRPYKALKPASSEMKNKISMDVAHYQPQFDKELYSCRVTGRTPFGKRFSLSGILFFKQLEDGSVRVVFQNQMGLTYFDFGWDSNNQFKVVSIIEQMDKPALIKTLRKDFELLLFKNISSTASQLMSDKSSKSYLKFDLQKGFVYYIFEDNKIVSIENADERRKVVVFKLSGAEDSSTFANKISVNHLRANFKIEMEKLVQE